MNRKTYVTVTAALFLVVAIVHLLRIILGWQVEIGGLSIPFWPSWLAVLVAGALHISALRRGGSRGFSASAFFICGKRLRTNPQGGAS